MNKIYRVIWSKTRNCYVVVSEIAKRHSKSAVNSVFSVTRSVLASAVLLGLTAGICAPVWAATLTVDTSTDDQYKIKRGETSIVVIGADANTGVTFTNTNNYKYFSVSAENGMSLVNNSNTEYFSVSKLGALSLNGKEIVDKDGNLKIGANASALGIYKVATDQYNNDSIITAGSSTASGQYAKSIGSGTTATGDFSTAWGVGTIANGADATAFGYKAKAYGAGSTAWGNEATAGDSAKSGEVYNATAWGNTTVASGKESTTWGNRAQATAQGATAWGKGTTASGEWATAFGQGTTASSSEALAFGLNTTASGIHSVAGGENSKATSDSAVALGMDSEANGKHSLAVGKGAKTAANTDGSIALGYEVQANGDHSFATGYLSVAGGSDSIAMGHTAKANGADAVAIGSSTTAVAEGVALGKGSVANTKSNEVGYHFNKTGTYSGATWTPTNNDVAVGNGNTLTRRITGVAAGSNDTDAVNVAQLKLLEGQIAGSSGDYRLVGSDGNDGAGETNKYTVENGKVTLKVKDTTSTTSDVKEVVIDLSGVDTDTKYKGAQTTANGTTSFTVSEDKTGGADVGTITLKAGDNVTIEADGDGAKISAKTDLSGVKLQFAGDDKGTNGVITRANEEQLNVAGGADASKLTDNNIGVVKGESDDTLTVKLSQELQDMTSITFNGGTVINSDGLTINNGPSFTTNKIDVAGNKIINVAPGEADTDAVNVSQLKGYRTQVTAGNNVTSVNAAEPEEGRWTYKIDVDNLGYKVNGKAATPVQIKDGINFVDGKNTTAVLNEDGSVTFDVDAAGLSGVHYYSVNADPEVQANYNNEGATGTNALAAGVQAKAIGENSVAIGNGATAEGTGAIVLGSGRARAVGQHAMAWGTDTYAGGMKTAVATNPNSSGSVPRLYYFINSAGNQQIPVDKNGYQIYQRNGKPYYGTNTLLYQHSDGTPVATQTKNGRVRYYKVTIQTYSSGSGEYLSYGEEVTADSLIKPAGEFVVDKTVANGTVWGNRTLSTGFAATAWGGDSAATGNFATAFGTETIASGPAATAFGSQTLASGEHSVAFGGKTKAEGAGSVAWGNSTRAFGDGYSTAFGIETSASGAGATAWGNRTTASYSYATAFGMNTKATRTAATAFGTGTEATSEYATAFGNGTKATNVGATAWGSGTLASAVDTTVWGDRSKAVAQDATAWGVKAYAGGPFLTTAWGETTQALGTRSTAFGSETVAKGEMSTSFGTGTASFHSYDVTWGRASVADGPAATAFGDSTSAIGQGATAWGAYTLAGNIRYNGEYATVTRTGTYLDETNKRYRDSYTITTQGVNGASVSERINVEYAQGSDPREALLTALQEKGVSYGTVGANATAWGHSTVASYDLATAFGRKTQATADAATAFGDRTKASGAFSTSFGRNTVASEEAATAFGEGTIAESTHTTAFGQNTMATGNAATSFGMNTLAAGQSATAFGSGTVAGRATYDGQDIYLEPGFDGKYYVKDITNGKVVATFDSKQDARRSISIQEAPFATVFGLNNIAGSVYTTAFGQKNKALGSMATAFGQNNIAQGFVATAFGQGTQATAIADTAFGLNTTASGGASTAFGQFTTAKGWTATAFGQNTKASNSASTAFGQSSVARGTAATAFGQNSSANGENSLAALGGTTGMGGTWDDGQGNTGEWADENSGKGAVAIGEGATAQPNYTYAIGQKALTGNKATNAIAIGNEAEAVRWDSDAGDFAAIDSALAIGTKAKAGATDAISIGHGSEVYGEKSIAIGTGNKIYGAKSSAIGDPNNLSGEDNHAQGNDNNIYVDHGYILGSDSVVALASSVALGYQSQTGDTLYKTPSMTVNGTTYTFAGGSPVGTVSVGAEGKERTITNVAAGRISATSTDAINGSQLYYAIQALNEKVVVEAGDSSVNVDSKVEPEDGTSGGTTGSGTTSGGDTGTTTGGNDAGNTAGTTTGGSTGSTTGGDGGDIEPSKTTTYIVTANTTTAEAGSDNLTVEDSNPGGDDATHHYTIDLAKDISVNNITVDNSVKVGGNTVINGDTISTTNIEGDTVNTNTINLGDNITIQEGDDNRITYKSGDTTYNIATLEDGMDFAGDDGKSIHKNLSEQLDIVGGAKDKASEYNIYTYNDGDKLRINLAKDIKGVDSVTVNKTINVGGNTTITGDTITTNTFKAGDTTINNDGLTIKGGPSVTKNGVDAGGKKIANVAPGEDGTDAVNVDQLNAAINQVGGDAINRLGDQVNRLDSRMRKGLAGAAALAALHPMDFDPDDKLTFAAGVGNYRGENAAAVGAFYRPDEKVMFSVGGTFGNGENMVNAGVSFSLDRVAHVTNSKTAMAREIMDLRRELTELKASMASGNWMLDPSLTRLFPDTEENHWAYEYVKTLAGNHIIEGYPDGEFKGDRMITRYEMAAILYRAMMNGAQLPDKALNEFAPELGRFRVDRVYGNGDDRHKVERIRVNDENRKDRDVYGSRYEYFKQNPGANVSTGALPGTKQAEKAAKAEAEARQAEKPSIVSEEAAS